MRITKIFLLLLLIVITTIFLYLGLARNSVWTTNHLNWKRYMPIFNKPYRNEKEIQEEMHALGTAEAISTQMTTNTPSKEAKADVTSHDGIERMNKSNRLSPEDQGVPKILIMTYMRSGSSFLGELMKYGGEVYYNFEPLWNIYGKGYRFMETICFRNTTCVKPFHELHSINATVSIMKKLFSCKLSELPKEVIYSFVQFPLSSGYSKKCIPIKSGKGKHKGKFERNPIHSGSFVKTHRYDSRVHKCLTAWESLCQRAGAHVIKTIRLSPEFAGMLLKEIPNLRIVHLTRDPRGIIRSRINVGNIKNESVMDHTTNLCFTMQNDIRKIKNSALIKSGRVMPLSFECLASQPYNVTEDLFRKIGLNYTNETVMWLNRHARNQPIDHDRNETEQVIVNKYKPNGYGVKEANSKTIAHAWKTKLKPELIRKIDHICNGLYKEMGIDNYNTAIGTGKQPYGHDLCL